MSSKTPDTSESENFFDRITNFLSNKSSISDTNVSTQTAEKSVLLGKLSKEKIDQEVNKIIASETGIERVKKLFSFDETLGNYSEYLLENESIIGSVSIFGFFLGSVLQAGGKADDFKKSTQLTIYVDRKQATRSFADYIYLETLKGGGKLAFRYGMFTGMMIGTAISIQAYRMKSSVLDYTVGGMVSGGVLRMHHGLYNLLFGSVVGGLFGSFYGIFRHTQLKLTGSTYEERRYKELSEQVIVKEMFKDKLDESKQN